MHELGRIASMVLQSLIHVWPLLLVSVPFAVILKLSGLAEKLRGAFSRRPIVGILIATAAGAFGPFCSCGVIPVVASMLIGGVPLAPVMSFWVASPTMDPEIFFMSAAFLGWPLAVARLVATLLLSLAAGFVTHWFVRQGWIGSDFLRPGVASSAARRSLWSRCWGLLRTAGARLRAGWASYREVAPQAASSALSCGCSEAAPVETLAGCCGGEPEANVAAPRSAGRWRRVLRECASVTLWVAQFMMLAFALEAIIKLYVPQDLIVQWIGNDKPWAPALAALIGIPLYVGNLTAMPLIGGLLQQGMSGGAALAFFITGPLTTIPAMAAVWGIVKWRVFALYLAVGLLGALILGYAYSVVRLATGGGT
ncbi:MAG: permease [Candidatus Bipolaricaulis sp.]|nr:permease [Candidatus Bipolaricaulis sp.]